MRIGVFGIPGAWSSEHLAEALRAQGVTSRVIPLASCLHDVAAGRVLWEEEDLSGWDGFVVKKLGDAADPTGRFRINLLRTLEARGVPVFSPPEAIEMASDRYRMTVTLAREGMPVPRTIVTDSVSQAVAAVDEFGRAVLKPIYTSKARGMVLLHAGEPLVRHLLLEGRAAEGSLPLYIQEFIPGVERDLAMAVLDRRLLGAYAREARSGEWITSTSRGGRYVAARLSREAVELSLRAARLFGLTYTVVDLVETPDGQMLIYEVSAFGGFRGLKDATGIDAAVHYAEHVLAVLAGRTASVPAFFPAT